MDITLERKEARKLFEAEKVTFQQLDQGDEQSALIILENPTDEQIKALTYLLIFVAKKEIPILKEHIKKVSYRDLKKLMKSFDKKPNEILTLPKDKLLSLLRRFGKYFSFLVKPILYEH